MSNRSSLSFPSQTSGSIGSSVSAVQSTSSISLITGVITEIAKVEVPAGVYSVSFCVNIEVLDATTPTSIFVYVGTSSSNVGTFTEIVSAQDSYLFGTSTAQVAKQVYYTTTIVLNESSNIYGLCAWNGTGAGVNCISLTQISSPAQNIVAIKIA